MNQETLASITPFLEYAALQLRKDSIRATTASKSGHPTSCLSAADIVAALFFHVMHLDLKNPHNPDNDRFILSKGHAIPVVYAAWKQLGVISDEELLTLRMFSSVLEGHPTPRFTYNEASTGSLGQGLSIGVGMALSARMDKKTFTTYVMMGDGEIAEGSIWEACELAAYYKLNNLIGIVDCNRLGQSEQTLSGHNISSIAKKFDAFGWHTIEIDGHDMSAIVTTLTQAHTITDKPIAIIAKTYKGYGLDDRANKEGYHGKPVTDKELQSELAILDKHFAQAASYRGEKKYIPPAPQTLNDSTQDHTIKLPNLEKNAHVTEFVAQAKLATRRAFGYALQDLGAADENIVVLDGDVKNSTYTDIFEKDFPKRFVQCFIAEQNMVGVACGLSLRGKKPFAATFGAFFSRAFDQIRMAGIGRLAVRLVGSHAGVSIGEDGPSQMALEDIAIMRSVPQSIVLYPSDSVSTYKLTELMSQYNDGISYLRTTRAETKNLYPLDEKFVIGGCKVLRRSAQDLVCIIAAGITLHEALAAYETLKQEKINIALIDLYSIKPLDIATIIDIARTSHNKIISAEDHYLAGGMGEAIAGALADKETTNITHKILCVRELSRSGKPEELLAYAHIDRNSIIEAVRSLVKNSN